MTAGVCPEQETRPAASGLPDRASGRATAAPAAFPPGCGSCVPPLLRTPLRKNLTSAAATPLRSRSPRDCENPEGTAAHQTRVRGIDSPAYRRIPGSCGPSPGAGPIISARIGSRPPAAHRPRRPRPGRPADFGGPAGVPGPGSNAGQSGRARRRLAGNSLGSRPCGSS